ncbi:tripartite tricarboxylate transporter substrate-binding protein [Bradyrhizobium sp. BWA-3-5]|jgi:tripartite-type tricarboxylate transporter receptor subunit TctC|uniref:tripartite tricarboxylate transporter substrate-binding protein n=1 Tax=Bradyrhizobium sp. BWA-3-5 TaxID=3080013 RepID=UPI00293EEE13|nr:tripartite tricarboxylate transporter substrate-binding protein [Bradyrhizobium sp. BWA-3-5]WOH65801.1 tripartite tricarboxylate transporter substrate-binding protein [Bradyrhizobium sp. BWA-3-5]
MILRTLAALLAVALNISAATAEGFPERQLTLIVPFPAGGPSDALGRAVAQAMAAHLKQAIIVENAGGASGTIGLTKLLKAPADGYSLGFGTIGTHVANVALFKRLPYDPLGDFEPVGLAGMAFTLLVAKPGLPVSNLQDFVTYARANREKLTYGSAGVGSISHYACVLLLSNLKLNITHVPYRGVAPAMNDLMGGHVDFMCDQTITALPQVLGGTIKAIAALSDQPLPQAPEVSTAAAAGYPGVNLRSWNAIFVRKGTPAPVRQKLNDALRAALADPDVMRQMAAVGVELPQGADLEPAAVSALIAHGLEHDVPVLRAKGEYLD